MNLLKEIGLLIVALVVVVFGAAFVVVRCAAALALPALAIWALGHFAFGWW